MYCMYNKAKIYYLNGSGISVYNLSARIDCVVFVFTIKIERERQRIKSISQYSRKIVFQLNVSTNKANKSLNFSLQLCKL